MWKELSHLYPKKDQKVVLAKEDYFSCIFSNVVGAKPLWDNYLKCKANKGGLMCTEELSLLDQVFFDCFFKLFVFL